MAWTYTYVYTKRAYTSIGGWVSRRRYYIIILCEKKITIPNNNNNITYLSKRLARGSGLVAGQKTRTVIRIHCVCVCIYINI